MTTDNESITRRARDFHFVHDDCLNYTRGPIGIVHASDGVEGDCAALLLNQRFTKSMKLALEMQHELDDEICATLEQGQKTRTTLEKLDEDLEQCQSR